MESTTFVTYFEVSATLEFMEEIGYASFVFDEMLKFKNDSGKKGFHYFTFKYNDWPNKSAHLIITEYPETKLLVTATHTADDSELFKAIEWVKEHNPHLEFHPTLNVGYEGSDFMMNLKSAALNFTIKELVNPE